MPRKQKTKDFFINSGSSCYTEPFISLLCGVALEMTPEEIHKKYNIKINERHYAAYATNLILKTIANINEILPRLVCIGDENYISSTFIRFRKQAGLSGEEILHELESSPAFVDLRHEEYKAYLRELAIC